MDTNENKNRLNPLICRRKTNKNGANFSLNGYLPIGNEASIDGRYV